LYDPSFLGAYGRLRQQEMVTDAERRAARWKAKPPRAGRRAQRAERRRRHPPVSWRLAAWIRREPSEGALQPNFGDPIRFGCVGGDNGTSAVSDRPPHAQGVEVVFEAGPTSHRDILELLGQVHRW
jgi:hypothetical protein